MTINKALPSIRLVPRETDFLDRKVGQRGELYVDVSTFSVRVYDAVNAGGHELAKSDMTNISETTFVDLARKSGMFGPNIHIHNVTVGGDVDYVTFTVGTSSITALYLTKYVGVDLISWFGIQEGTAWTAGYDVNQMVMQHHFGPSTDNYGIGDNVLAATETILAANTTYTMRIQQTGSRPTEYIFSTNPFYTSDTIPADYSSNPSAPTVLYQDASSTPPTEGFSGDYNDLINTPTIPESLTDLGITDGSNGQVLTTNGSGTFTFTTLVSGGGNVLVVSDDGQYTTSESTLTIVGGSNIATEVINDSNELTINLSPFSINYLTDVDTSTITPSVGNVLKWDGSKWAPGVDATSGGAGTDADTLDGFNGAYYLNYNNFTNTPTVLTLAGLSVGNERAASGDGGIEYDNTTGVFRYTPPNLSGYATTSSLSSYATTASLATVATSGSYTDLSSKPTIPAELTDLGITDGSNGQVLTTNGSGTFTFTTVAGVNSFTSIAVTGQSTISADGTSDTLTLVGGIGIAISTDAGSDTITIAATGGGVTSFSELSDVVASSLRIDRIYLPAITMLTVTHSGATAYLFDQYTGNNPTIYAITGTTIAFDLDGTTGHPFLVQDATGTNFTTGLIHVSSTGVVSTGSNAQGKTSGTLYWKIPDSASGTCRYQCSIHSAMVGSIIVKNFVSV